MGSVMAAQRVASSAKPLILTGARAFGLAAGERKGRAGWLTSAAAASTAAAADVTAATTATAATAAAATAAAPPPPWRLPLALARETVGADVAERGLHRIGLVGAAGRAVVAAGRALRTGPGAAAWPWPPPLPRRPWAGPCRRRPGAPWPWPRLRVDRGRLRAAVAIAAARGCGCARRCRPGPCALRPGAVPRARARRRRRPPASARWMSRSSSSIQAPRLRPRGSTMAP